MGANRRTHALEFRTTVNVVLAVAVFALAGCVGGGTATEGPVPADALDVADIAPAESRRPDPPDSFTDTGLVGRRPYRFRVPRIYDRARPAPLVILLHGYGVSGWAQDLYFGFGQLAERRGFLYAYPDGVRDAKGLRFWNAFPSLAAAGVSLPDDVGYITAIIDDMSARFNVDAHRVYLVGHSNGAFLAYRYACEHPTRIAAIAGLAGAMLADASPCSPSARVAILHIHGDADARISYSGGTIRGIPYLGDSGGTLPGVPYLGAVDSVARWAGINGCGPFEPTEAVLDLESSRPGAETSVSRHNACAGGAAELWTIHGAGHIPVLGPEWATTVYGWLTAHTRP